jgi:hypothetical protein
MQRLAASLATKNEIDEESTFICAKLRHCLRSKPWLRIRAIRLADVGRCDEGLARLSKSLGLSVVKGFSREARATRRFTDADVFALHLSRPSLS